MLKKPDGPSGAGRSNAGLTYTDDDHRFIEKSFKMILERAYPLPAEDQGQQFQGLLDALSRVSARDS